MERNCDRVDYMWRKIEESIMFRMYKVTVFYYRNESADSVFTLILDGFN